MKTQPIEPAVVTLDAEGLPYSPRYGDRYHARAGAFEQARQVFLAGNGLPERWRGRERFVVLETGFGLGHNFLAAWQAWRDDLQRCARLDFVSVERHPLRLEDLRRAHAASPEPALAAELVAAWPPLTPGLHLLSFAGGRLRLYLAFGDAQAWARELVLQADAFFLDGFAPACNPQMWDRHLLKALARLAAPGATAATWSAAREVRDGLAAAGFEVSRAPGFAGKRSMTLARHAPRHALQRPAGRPPPGTPPRERRDVLVIGAGLAGAAVARALAEQDCDCLVLESAAAAARHSSGNPAGLFHGTVHRDDGPHAQWQRGAALAAARRLAPALRAGALAGALDGLLRVETGLDAPALQALARRLGLPPDYAQPLEAPQASQRAGLALMHPAWLYPQGGWVDPAAWVRLQLQHPNIGLRCSVEVAGLRADAGQWIALDRGGGTLARAHHVVIAAGLGLSAWAGELCLELIPARGQITRIAAAGLVQRPRLPISGSGYALMLDDAELLCGATSHPDDADPSLRDEDTAYNLERLRRLGVELTERVPAGSLAGRVCWRLNTADRLPVVGAVPAGPVPGLRADQARYLPRQPGLWMLGALGSRGIAGAALGAEVIAAGIAGAPLPLASSLLDAVDPARGRVRLARRAGPSSGLPG